MPIIGKIYARPRRSTVKRMPFGETAMLDIDELAITRTAIYLHLEAEVVYLEDEETIEEFLESQPGFIPIKRIGDGLTEHDFELDFSTYEATDGVVLLESPTFFEIRKKDYITFTDGKVRTTRKKPAEKSIDDLRKDLEDAKEREDWDEAVKLRNKIIEVENKDKKNG